MINKSARKSGGATMLKNMIATALIAIVISAIATFLWKRSDSYKTQQAAQKPSITNPASGK